MLQDLKLITMFPRARGVCIQVGAAAGTYARQLLCHTVLRDFISAFEVVRLRIIYADSGRC